jgi:hypothetical protein
MGECPPGRSIDRVDNDGDYTRENCRWATDAEQMRNTRRSRRLTAFGRTMNMTDWAEEAGVSISAIAWRLKVGWPIEEAVSRPAMPAEVRSRGLQK